MREEIPDSYYCGLALLRKIMGLFFLSSALIILSRLDLIMWSRPLFDFDKGLFFLNGIDSGLSNNPKLIVGSVLLFSLLLSIDWFPKVSSILLWFFLNYFLLLNPFAFNGSHVFAHNILLYLVFADTKFNFREFFASCGNRPTVREMNFRSSLARFCIIFHLAFVYFSSAIFKLEHPTWGSGEAIYYSLSSELLSATRLSEFITKIPPLYTTATYLVLLWELAFPFLLLSRLPLKYLIFSGLFFHWVSCFLMKLDGFWIVFPATYLCLISDSQFKKFVSRVQAGLSEFSQSNLMSNLKKRLTAYTKRSSERKNA